MMVITDQERKAAKREIKRIDIPEEVKLDVVDFIKSSSGNGSYYLISKEGDQLKCSCPHNTFREVECKHIKEYKNGNRTRSGICESDKKKS